VPGYPYFGLVFQHRVLSGACANDRERERERRERERERERGGGYCRRPRARGWETAPHALKPVGRAAATTPHTRSSWGTDARSLSLSLCLSFSLYPSLSFSISPRMPPRRRCHPLFPRDACSPHDRDPRVPRECRRDSL